MEAVEILAGHRTGIRRPGPCAEPHSHPVTSCSGASAVSAAERTVGSVKDTSRQARHTVRSELRPLVRPLRVTVSTVPGTAVVVRVEGELDQDTQPLLRDALAKAIRQRPGVLVVDLSDLAFCYSVCLNTLLTARLDAQALGLEMVLAGATPQALRLLEITGVDQLFTLRTNVRSALADRLAG